MQNEASTCHASWCKEHPLVTSLSMGANRLSQVLGGIVRQAAVNSFTRLLDKVLETPLEMCEIWWTDSPTPLRCMFPRARQLSVNPISLQVVWNSSAALHGSFFTDCRYSAY